MCSGTVRIPEHCFGNSGENWSARRRKQEKGVTDERRDDHHNGMEKGVAHQRLLDQIQLSLLIHFID